MWCTNDIRPAVEDKHDIGDNFGLVVRYKVTLVGRQYSSEYTQNVLIRCTQINCRKRNRTEQTCIHPRIHVDIQYGALVKEQYMYI